MKLGKMVNDEMLLVECEFGKEVHGNRTVESLYEDGYKDVCEIERPSENVNETWQEYPTCWIQVWETEEV